MVELGIIEDDAEIRQGLELYLRAQNDIHCLAAEESVERFLAVADAQGMFIDVLIMDIGLPGISGIEGIALVKERMPETDIVMFTVYDDPERIFRSLCAGASGYLLKTTPFPKIKEAVITLRNGWAPMSPQIAQKVFTYFGDRREVPVKSPLTQKEKEVVLGLVDGLSYKMIADRMNVSIDTIRFHIKNIYKKLNVNSKSEAVIKALKERMV